MFYYFDSSISSNSIKDNYLFKTKIFRILNRKNSLEHYQSNQARRNKLLIYSKAMYEECEPYASWSEGGSTRWMGSRQGAITAFTHEGCKSF